MATSTASRMASSPLLPTPPPSHWRNIRYRNAAISIRGGVVSVSEDDVSDAGEQEVQLQVAVNVVTFTLTPPPSSIRRQDSQVTYAHFPLSQPLGFRELLPDSLLNRPDLDDGYADFLVDIVGLFALIHQLSYSATPRTLWMQLSVNVVVVETETETETETAPPPLPAPRPQLEKIIYDEGGESAELNETACPICLQDFQTGEELGKTMCGHPFHPHCLGRWLERNPVCPLCRSRVLQTDAADD